MWLHNLFSKSPFSGKKISRGGDSSSQKFSTVVVSSDPLINLVDIVTDRVDTANV